MKKATTKRPSALLSFIPLLALVCLLFITIRTFGTDAISGSSQIVLLTGTAVTSMLAMVFCKVKWQTIEDTICNNIHGVSTAIIILLLIGALSGSWMVSGIVPTMIYYGMKLIDPNFFLAASCVICALVSVMTGSSWTTIAIIGVALMGIGKAQGFTHPATSATQIADLTTTLDATFHISPWLLIAPSITAFLILKKYLR